MGFVVSATDVTVVVTDVGVADEIGDDVDIVVFISESVLTKFSTLQRSP